MNRSIFTVFLATFAFGSQAVIAQSADYDLDPSHTSLVFSTSHFGYSYTFGRFNKLAGAFRFDKNNPSASAFTVEIDAASLDTNDKKRDEHLQSPDFFDVRQFPKIAFQTTSVTASGNDLKLTGKITLHGVTKEVTIPLKYLGEGNGPYGKYRCGFYSNFRIKRSEFGMKGMLEAIGDDINIIFSFEGVQR